MGKLVTIARFYLVSEAEVARATLEGNGIQAYLTDTHTIGINQILTWALGGVQLQVFESDVAMATECLEQTGFGDTRPRPVAQPSFNICPKCHGANLKYHYLNKLLFVLAFATFGGAMLFWKPQHTCLDCGHRWKA